MNDIIIEDILGNRIYGDSRVDINVKVIEKFYGDIDL